MPKPKKEKYDHTINERSRRFLERQKEAGMVRKGLWVRPEWWGDILALIAKLEKGECQRVKGWTLKG